MTPLKPEDAEEDREQLEATQREIERLNRLRQNVASGLLEVSHAAKRDAERLLSDTPKPSVPVADIGSRTDAPRTSRAGWSNPFLYGLFAVGLMCGFALAMLMRPPVAGPQPTDVDDIADVTDLDQRGPELATVPTRPETPGTERAPAMPASQRRQTPVAVGSGFVLTLTPNRTCWLRSRVDGGEPLERLLPPGRTIVLEVEDEASLRIGDASAMSLLINNQPTKPLGGEGQAVTVRITSANLDSFLLDAPDNR